jgi:hypothetical protein
MIRTDIKKEWILISYSSKERASQRMGKSPLNIKRIKAINETQAVLKKNQYLKKMDAVESRFVLDVE